MLTIPLALYDPGSVARQHFEWLSAEPARIWNLPLVLGGWALFVLAATELVYRRIGRSGRFAGAVLATAVLSDSIGRFALEFLREEQPVWLGFNPWQLVLALLAVGSAIWLAVLSTRRWSLSKSSGTVASPES